MTYGNLNTSYRHFKDLKLRDYTHLKIQAKAKEDINTFKFNISYPTKCINSIFINRATSFEFRKARPHCFRTQWLYFVFTTFVL